MRRGPALSVRDLHVGLLGRERVPRAQRHGDLQQRVLLGAVHDPRSLPAQPDVPDGRNDAGHLPRAVNAGQSPADTRALGQYIAPQRPPLVPELELWLLAGHVDMNARCAELLAGGYAPYWAFCWGSGQALARHVLDHPELVRGRVAVDFGAGSAVVALAAARAGAARAVAVDIDPQARRFAALNAERNALVIEVAERVPARWEVLFASDVLYEEPIARWLEQCAGEGRAVYVADPHRHGAPRLRHPPLRSLPATTFPDVDYPMHSAFIYRL
jgi:predicted nicotinamide N-methyase